MNKDVMKKLQDYMNEIFDDEIYISGKTTNLKEEIKQNTWGIGLPIPLLKKTTIDMLLDIVKQLLKKREQQILLLNVKTIATFYLWFDELALQLRFNLISGQQTKLPFNCDLKIIDKPNEILKDFLKYSYRNHLERLYADFLEFNCNEVMGPAQSSQTITEEDKRDDDPINREPLKVYKVYLDPFKLIKTK